MAPPGSLPGREAAVPNPALAPWAAYIGEWETVGSHPYMKGIVLHGRASFSWLEGGAFLMMRSEITEPGIPSGLAVIGSDDATKQFFLLYFDERGVSRKYDVELTADGWIWSRNAPDFAQRFELTLSADGREIVGRGTMSRDGGAWEPDLELTYRKVGSRS